MDIGNPEKTQPELLSKQVILGFGASGILCCSVIFLYLITGVLPAESFFNFQDPSEMLIFTGVSYMALILYGMLMAYLLPAHLIDETNKSFADHSNGLIFFFMLTVVLFEELLFRGIIQNAFLLIFKNEWAAVILATGVFVIMHTRYFMKPVMFLNILLPGIVFGWVYFAADNILVPVAVHFILNVSMTLLFKYNLIRLRI